MGKFVSAPDFFKGMVAVPLTACNKKGLRDTVHHTLCSTEVAIIAFGLPKSACRQRSVLRYQFSALSWNPNE